MQGTKVGARVLYYVGDANRVLMRFYQTGRRNLALANVRFDYIDQSSFNPALLLLDVERVAKMGLRVSFSNTILHY